MRRLVLDTNVLIAFLRDPESFATRFSAYDLILLPPVVLGEFRAGLFNTKAGRENREALDAFLQNPAVKVCPMTDSTSLVYAKVFQSLRRAGTLVPTNDIWIAAAALESGAALATDDRHFAAVPLLQLA